jgi:ABC-type transport system involved in multi-copper enzyme maturation permease subunit
MIDTIAAEWLKLRSVRSTYILAGVVVACAGAALLLAWYAARIWDGSTPEQRTHFALSDVAELVGWVAQLCMALLGVLAVTGEYGSGMIRTTLAVVPRRATVLAAKASVVGTAAFLVGVAIPLLTYALSRLVIGDRPIRGSSTPAPDEIRLLLAAGLLIAVFALIGLGLGVILRSTAGAIVTVVALWYLLPIVALNLPSPWNDRLTSVMLINLARELAGGHYETAAPQGLLSPAGALVTMLVYAALPLGAATLLIRRRDA